MNEHGETIAADAPITALDQVLIDELLMLEGAMERNYEWVYDIIAPHLGRSLLEVGSGVGVVSRYLVDRGLPVVLSDHHPAYLAYLRSRFGARPNVDVRILDLLHPPYDVGRAVDTVVCLNVLEHIENDLEVLAALRDVLPSGGRLLLQVPNYPSLYGSLDRTYGHFRRYDRQSLAAALEAAGFRVAELRNFNPLAVPGWILTAKLLKRERLDVGAARLFNAFVPVVRRLDFLSRFGGLALIACAERR